MSNLPNATGCIWLYSPEVKIVELLNENLLGLYGTFLSCISFDTAGSVTKVLISPNTPAITKVGGMSK